MLRVVGDAMPQIWEQYSKGGRIWDTYKVYKLEAEKYFLARKRNPSFFEAAVAIDTMCLCQLRLLSNVTPTRLKVSLLCKTWPLISRG
jgi:hypothetical protein